MKNTALASLLLRIGLAIVFLYAAFASLSNPVVWIGFFPSFIATALPGTLVLTIFSIYEILLAIWLLTGKHIFVATILAALTMVGVLAANFGAIDIVFRDFAIFFAALALGVLHYRD